MRTPALGDYWAMITHATQLLERLADRLAPRHPWQIQVTFDGTVNCAPLKLLNPKQIPGKLNTILVSLQEGTVDAWFGPFPGNAGVVPPQPWPTPDMQFNPSANPVMIPFFGQELPGGIIHFGVDPGSGGNAKGTITLQGF